MVSAADAASEFRFERMDISLRPEPGAQRFKIEPGTIGAPAMRDTMHRDSNLLID